jgi:hypothetical protein
LLRCEPDLGRLDTAAPLDVDALVAVHHHLLHLRVGEQLLERTEPDGLAEDQLTETLAGRGLEDRGVFVHQLANGLRQRAQPSATGGGLRPAPLQQAPPQHGRQLVEMSAADALVHPLLSE